MTCPSCTRAQQVALHRDFRKTCPGCGIRQLALMESEERERMLDRICHLSGPKAREEVRKSVREELARIRKLRAFSPHQRAKAQ